MTPRSFWQNIVIIFILSALAVFLLHRQLFVLYLTFPVIPGADTMGHLEVGKYYAEHIFPNTWGWTDTWFSGMPFPQFYPPMFYMVVAFVSQLLPFSYDAVFRMVTVVLVLSIPGLLTLVASRFTKERAALYATGIVGVFLLATPFGRFDNLGVSLSSTLSVGLVTHALAFDFFLLWLWAFLGRKTSRAAYYSSIIFLALTALSSVHILPLTFVVYIVSAVFDFKVLSKPAEFFKYYIIPGLIAVGLTGFWFIPLLSVYTFMSTQSLTLYDAILAKSLFEVMHTWWPTALFFVVALTLAVMKRNKTALIVFISGLGALAPHVLHLDVLLPRFPLHPYRLLPFVYFTGALCVGYIVDLFVKNRTRLFKGWLLGCIALIFVIAWAPYSASEINLDYYGKMDEEKALLIADYMKDKTGMFAVEATNSGRYMHYLIQQAAQEKLRSNYTIFVDSSLTSLFDVPFRTTITSNGGEKLSVYSALANDPTVRQFKDSQVIANRAQALGVNYLLIKSEVMKTLLNKNKRFTLEKDFDGWAVYSIPEVVTERAVSVKYEPTLVFAPLGNKGKKSTAFSYLYLQAQTYIQNNVDLTFAYATDPYLDGSFDLDQFHSAVIANYTYRNEQQAFETLMTYAETNNLMLLASSDPLYKKLQQALTTNPRVTFIDYDAAKGEPELRSVSSKIFIAAEKVKEYIVPQPFVSKVGNGVITVHPATTTNESIPVLIKASYFPSWKRTDGAPLYMASPTYMLTFIHEDTELIFTIPNTVYIGYIITAYSLYVIGRMIYRDRRKVH